MVFRSNKQQWRNSIFCYLVALNPLPDGLSVLLDLILLHGVEVAGEHLEKKASSRYPLKALVRTFHIAATECCQKKMLFYEI